MSNSFNFDQYYQQQFNPQQRFNFQQRFNPQQQQMAQCQIRNMMQISRDNSFQYCYPQDTTMEYAQMNYSLISEQSNEDNSQSSMGLNISMKGNSSFKSQSQMQSNSNTDTNKTIKSSNGDIHMASINQKHNTTFSKKSSRCNNSNKSLRSSFNRGSQMEITSHMRTRILNQMNSNSNIDSLSFNLQQFVLQQQPLQQQMYSKNYVNISNNSQSKWLNSYYSNGASFNQSQPLAQQIKAPRTKSSFLFNKGKKAQIINQKFELELSEILNDRSKNNISGYQIDTGPHVELSRQGSQKSFISNDGYIDLFIKNTTSTEDNSNNNLLE